VRTIGGEEKIELENILEQSFPISKVINTLKKSFDEVTVSDESDADATEASSRVFSVCRIA